MGNVPSMFCPSESPSQCIGKDSLVFLPCSIGVMLTPVEKRLAAGDVSHQRFLGSYAAPMEFLAIIQKGSRYVYSTVAYGM
jgi:hypothetical protein